jgi:signal transduction histidine kinase
LLSEKSGATDTIKHSLAAAHDQIIFLGNLINDLAMLSKAERGAIGMEIDTFSPGGMATSLAADYQRMAEVKKLEIRTAIEETPTLRSSSLYVREILQNFVTNAIKYTQKGSVTIGVKAKDSGIEFSVADTGIGIGKSEQAKLFEKFFRSSDWRVREANGTGLGLYVTSKLAKTLGATVSVTSEAEKGSIFSIYIPNMPEDKQQK